MVALNYIGQCGFVIFSDKWKMAIDPVLNDLKDDNGNPIRNYPPVIAYDELDVDYILCTHDHIDHMAFETLVEVTKLYGDTKIIIPNGCKDELIKNGIKKSSIIGLADGEVYKIAEDVTVKGVSTAHPVHQTDENGLDHNLAYSIELEGKRLVHLGDTYMTERLEKSLLELGEVDVLFPPINGRDEKREAKGIIGNLSCEEAAEISAKLKARLVVPTHFDMVKGNEADPFEFEECLNKLDAGCRIWIPTLKEQNYVE